MITIHGSGDKQDDETDIKRVTKRQQTIIAKELPVIRPFKR